MVPASAPLQVFFGDAGLGAFEQIAQRLHEAADRLDDRHDIVAAAERFGAGCVGQSLSLDVYLYGIMMQRTRSSPSASTDSAAHIAESMPPESPSTTFLKPFCTT